MNEKLAVVTTTINPPVLSDFLKSIKKQKNTEFHVFIIDITKSEDASFENLSNVTFVRAENRGFAYSINEGLKIALKMKFTKFCVINDDTLFTQEFIAHVHSSLKKHPGSIIGGKILYAPGYEYHKEKYKKDDLGKVIWAAGGGVNWAHALPYHRGVDEIDHGQYEKFEQVTYLTGALLFFDKTVLEEIGFWDEGYFLFYEDADWCERAKRKKIKLCYDPSVVIWHKVSQSTGGSGSALHVKYQTRNHLIFGLRYAPLKTKLHLLKNFVFNRFKKK